MAKFNSKAARTETFQEGIQTARTSSPIKTVGKTVNADGYTAFERDTKSELFLLAVSNFVGQNTFYESADARDTRFENLVKAVAVSDTAWFVKFVGWLRTDGLMRSGAIVAAAEGAKALLDAGKSGKPVRSLVASAMARADEPGEFLAYWTSKYGKNLPQSVKKGVADAAKKLYNEYSLLKYDTESKGFRFADVIQLTHAKAEGTQNLLFKYALNRRYGTDGETAGLFTITTRNFLMGLPVNQRKSLVQSEKGPQILKDAGMTWEALAGWLQGPMDADAWEAIIPSMGYMALLRNLRNFQQAGISRSTMSYVLNKLSDPAEVAKSKQFPFRFLAAYQANKNNLQIASTLELALNESLANVPVLKGRTLILVDTSGSMYWSTDKNMDLTFANQAAIFGSALALRAEDATLVQFGSSSQVVNFRKGDSILPMLSKFTDLGGTSTNAAIQRHYTGHDRVILITDEQYNSGKAPSVPANVPMYTWNLGGYRAGHAESGSNLKHTFGGLTDKAFQMIPLLEAGLTQVWPWEVAK